MSRGAAHRPTRACMPPDNFLRAAVVEAFKPNDESHAESRYIIVISLGCACESQVECDVVGQKTVASKWHEAQNFKFWKTTAPGVRTTDAG